MGKEKKNGRIWKLDFQSRKPTFWIPSLVNNYPTSATEQSKNAYSQIYWQPRIIGVNPKRRMENLQYRN
jgi:hypothetical protein